jgi:hypothetical protein
MPQAHLQQADIEKDIPLSQPDVIKQKDLEPEDQHMVIPGAKVSLGWDITPIEPQVGLICNTVQELADNLEPGQTWELKNSETLSKFIKIKDLNHKVGFGFHLGDPSKAIRITESYRTSNKYITPPTICWTSVKVNELPIELIGKIESKLTWDIKSTEPELGLEVNTIKELSEVLRPGQVWHLVNSPLGKLHYYVISANQQNVEIFITPSGDNLTCSMTEITCWTNGAFKNPAVGGWFKIDKEFLPAKLVDTIKPDNNDIEQQASEIQADLYNDLVYTVIPKNHKIELGIFPEDQHFSSKYVFVWNTYRDLLNFKEDVWQKISVAIPQGLKHTVLKPMVGGAYSLTHIPNTWKIEPVDLQPMYE